MYLSTGTRTHSYDIKLRQLQRTYLSTQCSYDLITSDYASYLSPVVEVWADCRLE